LNSAMAANVAGANAAIVTANTAMKGYVDAVSTAWTANAGTQQTQINAINSNVTAANAAIATLQTQVYTNANVAAYLPTYTGNLQAGNATIINTLTANTVITGSGGIRSIAGGTPTVTINFNTDKIIHVYQPAGTVTLQYGTLAAGSSVTVLINFAAQHNIVTGVSASNNINLAGKINIGGVGNAPAATAQTLVKLVYTSVDGTAGNTYCAVQYT